MDTSVIAHWVMGKGGILGFLIDELELTREFQEVYLDRYSDSVSLMDRLITSPKMERKEFCISYMVINELFSAIKDETNCLLLFKNGYPVSRWRDPRINQDLPDAIYKGIFRRVAKSLDDVGDLNNIDFVMEQNPENKNYLETYSYILLMVRGMRTQDCTLLTNAILNGAAFFITKDETLRKRAGKIVKKEYDLEIVSPSHIKAMI